MPWDSGARSVAVLNNDGWYAATLKNPVGVMGGLNDADTGASYIDIKFGFRALNGVIDAVSTGARLGTNAFTYSGQLEVFVGRMLGVLFVSYRALGSTATKNLQNGMPVPGSQIVYQTDITGTAMPTGLIQSLLTSPQFFDASLYAPGDAIYDLELTDAGTTGGYGTGGAVFEPMLVHGVGGGANGIKFLPMQVSGTGEGVYAGSAKMLPPKAFGLARPVAIFPPMEVTGSGGVNLVAGGTAVSAPLKVTGLAQGTTGGRATFGYLRATGLVDDTAVEANYGSARFPAMWALGQGTHGINTGSAVFRPMGAVGATTLSLYSFGWARSAALSATGLAANHVAPGVTINVALAGFSGAEPADRYWESTLGAVDFADSVDFVTLFDDVPLPADEVFGSSITRTDSSGTGIMSDAAALGASVIAEGVATGSDAYDTTVSSNPTETATASETVTLSVSALEEGTATASGEAIFGLAPVDAEETASADDSVWLGATSTVTDPVTATGTVIQVIVEDAEGAATATEVLSSTSDVDVDVDDLALAQDVIASITSGVDIVSEDIGRLIDEALAAVREPTAWVLNSDTSATYWYSSWPFSHMAQTPDGTFAVGPDGLYKVGGTTDAGAPIKAQVEYDYNEFGSYDKSGDPVSMQEIKRVDTVYLSMESGTPLALKMKVWGDSKVYTYNTARSSTVGPRSDRFKPGLGLKGRYFKLALENTDGGSFSVNDVFADVAFNKRRL